MSANWSCLVMLSMCLVGSTGVLLDWIGDDVLPVTRKEGTLVRRLATQASRVLRPGRRRQDVASLIYDMLVTQELGRYRCRLQHVNYPYQSPFPFRRATNRAIWVHALQLEYHGPTYCAGRQARVGELIG
ncbi:hypothetical protein QBC44DRAFT_331569 [Cladorrhinum sp. PSN332]|nr:hypothetical protein QBC44DRAFT_331569 [Cladorrhinum sp. PSN332]